MQWVRTLSVPNADDSCIPVEDATGRRGWLAIRWHAGRPMADSSVYGDKGFALDEHPELVMSYEQLHGL